MSRLFFVAVAVAMMTVSASSCGSRASLSHHQHNQEAGETHAHIRVEANCGMCKTRIETAAKGVTGVSSATYDLQARQLHLDFDASKTSLDAIAKAVAAAGHDNELHRADDAVYAALHSCCLYRN